MNTFSSMACVGVKKKTSSIFYNRHFLVTYDFSWIGKIFGHGCCIAKDWGCIILSTWACYATQDIFYAKIIHAWLNFPRSLHVNYCWYFWPNKPSSSYNSCQNNRKKGVGQSICVLS